MPIVVRHVLEAARELAELAGSSRQAETALALIERYFEALPKLHAITRYEQAVVCLLETIELRKLAQADRDKAHAMLVAIDEKQDQTLDKLAQATAALERANATREEALAEEQAAQRLLADAEAMYQKALRDVRDMGDPFGSPKKKTTC